MAKQLGKRALNLDIPIELYNMYAKLCIDLGITKTDGIIQYLQYLHAQYYKNRRALNEHSQSDFQLDDRKPQ